MNLKSHYALTSVILMICITFLPACNTPSPVGITIAQAAEYMTQGEYSAAENLYHNLLLNGEDAEIALALVDLYILWQRPRLGLDTLDKALAQGIHPTEVITQQLTMLVQDQQWPAVVGKAQMHITGDASHAYSWQALTTAYLALNQCYEARTASEKAWLANQGNPEVTLTYSLLHQDIDVLCSADAEMCVTAKACESFCYPEIGLKLVKRNRWSLANCILQQAAGIDPKNAAVHIWLGESLARIDQPEAAETHFYKAVEIDPANAVGWLLLGTFAYKTGDWDTARAALLNAQRLDPTNPAPCLGIAELKAAQGLYDEVDVWIKAALERGINDINIWKAAALFYINRNLVQTDLPTQIAEGAVRLNAQDAEAHLLLGWSHLLTGNTTTALSEIDQAIALDASLGQAYYLKSVLMELMRNTEQAEKARIHAADLGYFP